MNKYFRAIRRRRYDLLLFSSLSILYASSYFQRTAVPGTIFNALQSTYGFSAEEISGLGACLVTVYAFLQLVAGMLIDKFNAVRVVIYCGVLFCIGVLLFPLCLGNLPLMYTARILVGAGSSVMYLSLLRESDRIFGRKNYTLLIGLIAFLGYSGGLVATLPFAKLCQYFDWKILLLLVGIISAVLYLIFYAVGRKVKTVSTQQNAFSLKPLWEILKNPLTWIGFYCTSVNFSCYFILQSVFGMKFLEDVAGMTPSSASAIIFSLTLVCMFTLLGNGVFCRLLDNRRRPLVLFSTAIALFYTLLMLAAIYFKMPPAIFAIAYFLSAIASGSSGTYIVVVQEVNDAKNQTQSAAFVNMGCYLAVAIASVLIGKLLDSFVDPAIFAAGQKIIYPEKAYIVLFALLLIPTGLSFLLSLFLPETRGKFLKNR